MYAMLRSFAESKTVVGVYGRLCAMIYRTRMATTATRENKMRRILLEVALTACKTDSMNEFRLLMASFPLGWPIRQGSCRFKGSLSASSTGNVVRKVQVTNVGK